MDNSFVEWLEGEMRKRDWSGSELARRAGVSQSAVSLVLSGSRNPGTDFCDHIARAFRLSPDTVYRYAGYLPSKPNDDEVVSEIAHISHALTEDNRQDLLDYARLRLQKQEKEHSGKRIDKRTKMLE